MIYILVTIAQEFIDTKVDAEAVWEFDMQFVLNVRRQLMGYGGSGYEYFGAQIDGTYD